GSTVVSQLVTRPSFQVGVSVSVLTASLRRRERRRRLDVRDQSADLAVGPASAYWRHVTLELRRVLAFHEQGLQALEVGERSVPRDGGSDIALSLEPVALRADGLERLLAELTAREAGFLLHPSVVCALLQHGHLRVHDRVLDAAKLRAFALPRPRVLGLEA